MTKYIKRYVNLWIKEDKNKLPMLSGKDKTTGNYYYVFTDKEDDKIKRLAMSADGDMVNIGTLIEGSSDYGTYLKFKNYFIAENRFYDEEDPFMKNREGDYIMDKNGEKIGSPEYTLTISKEDKED